MKRLIQWLIRTAAAAALLAPLAGRANTALGIRSQVSVTGPDILLRDLAAAPDSLPPEWATRVVLPAPVPGKPQPYPLTAVAYALQKYPDMADISLRGEMNLTIQREGVPYDPRLIAEALAAHVQADERWQDTRVQVELDPRAGPVLVPREGRVELLVDGFRPDERVPGDFIFDATLLVNGARDRALSLRARVNALQEFWVAARPLDRGACLGADDVVRRWYPQDSVRRGFIPATEPVAGFQVNRTFRPDQPLVRYYLQQPVCAERGELVNVQSQRGGLRVTLRARALGPGRLGERILCMNEVSKRRVLVRMVGPRLAVLDIPNAGESARLNPEQTQ